MVVPNNILFDEVARLIASGQEATLTLSGTSMQPTLPDKRCRVTLVPLTDHEQVGDVVLFRYQGQMLLHRIIKIEGNLVEMQGDNCYSTETVTRGDLVARLSKVKYDDGRTLACNSQEWMRRSKKALHRKWLRNILIRCTNRRMRSRLRPWYFILLAILMWAPLNGLAAQFPNYVLGLRADHFVHASIYLLCAPMLMDLFCSRRRWIGLMMLWLACLAIGLTTESVQALLPYRGYDVNDLVANAIGATLGWMIVMVRRRR